MLYDATGTPIEIDGSDQGVGIQWSGKKWYAYGTSLTNTSGEGRYARYLAQLANLTLVNKGISGGSIMGNVKNAVMNTTDGKTQADLITLECGANDRAKTLGTIYDTGNTTFCGNLNQCIRYLQENTSAQIVIMPSTVGNTMAPEATMGTDNHTWAEQREAIRQICILNGCYMIPLDQLGLGYVRAQNKDYVADNIHHTALGGYNLARGVWGFLKNIPLWYSAIPE